MQGIGIHALVWFDNPTQPGLEMALENSAELGFDMIEIPNLDPADVDVDGIAKRARDLGLRITVSGGMPMKADVSSVDKDKVERGKRILLDTVALTRDFGGHDIAGVLYSGHGKFTEPPTVAGRKNAVEVIAEVADVAKDAGVTLNIEAVNRFESNLVNSAAQAVGFIQDTGSDNVRLHLDTFHMNIEEASFGSAVRIAGPLLNYLHVGESNRGFLGTGRVDLGELFDATVDIGFDGFVTFEAFSLGLCNQRLVDACAVWRDAWGDSRAISTHAKATIEAAYRDALRRSRAANSLS